MLKFELQKNERGLDDVTIGNSESLYWPIGEEFDFLASANVPVH